jgi:cytochrome bd-type quinol oxidase subunit 2
MNNGNDYIYLNVIGILMLLILAGIYKAWRENRKDKKFDDWIKRMFKE